MKKGLTLAEVIIVIGILGIIAESTIPSLIADYKTKTTIVSLKKAYSTLTSAYKLAEQENGTPDNWNLIGYMDQDGAVNMLNALVPYLRVTKNCAKNSGCFSNQVIKKLGGDTWINFDTYAYYSRVQLADGTFIASLAADKDCLAVLGTSTALKSVCGVYYVDVNGYKKPNQGGLDTFMFILTKSGIIPAGSAFDNGDWSFDNECKSKLTDTSTTGEGCAAWLIYNDNMDYLKCSDLGWGTKLKCN